MTVPPRIRQAVILAGPGPRAPVHSPPRSGIPQSRGREIDTQENTIGTLAIVDRVMSALARQGFTDIIIATDPDSETGRRYAARSLDEARVSTAPWPAGLGTAGLLQSLLPRLDPAFLILDGHSWFDIALRGLEATLHDCPSAQAVLALRHVPRQAGSELRAVLDPTGCIRRLQGGHGFAIPAPGLVHAGVTLCRREAVAGAPNLDGLDGPVPRPIPSPIPRPINCSSPIERGLLPALAARGHLYGRLERGPFYRTGEPVEDTEPKARRPALFLTQDCVETIASMGASGWRDGTREAIRWFNTSGWFVFLVEELCAPDRRTNPQWRGASGATDFREALQDMLAQGGAHVDRFIRAEVPPLPRPGHARPANADPGLLLRTMLDWPVLRERSLMIARRYGDIEAGHGAGLPAFRFPGGDLLTFADTIPPFLLEPVLPSLRTPTALDCTPPRGGTSPFERFPPSRYKRAD